MGKQEIFDKAWNGLKSQGFVESRDDERGICCYRGPGGLRCALGWCIPDERYSTNLENMSGDDRPVIKAVGASPKLAGFLESLQGCHDYSTGPESMERNLRNFASDHELTVPV